MCASLKGRIQWVQLSYALLDPTQASPQYLKERTPVDIYYVPSYGMFALRMWSAFFE